MVQTQASRGEAQRRADRLQVMLEELGEAEREGALALSDEQRGGLEGWAAALRAGLQAEYDIDTTQGERRMSWGMRIASLLGGLALCAAVVLFVQRWWGYLGTAEQVSLTVVATLAALVATEFAARREKTLYFAGLGAMLATACFIQNLSTVGEAFNIRPTQNALLAWALFCGLLAYRYGLRLMLVGGLGFLFSWVSATMAEGLGHHWLEFGNRPEHWLLLGTAAFAVGCRERHGRHGDFPPVYRLAGAVTWFVSLLVLAEGGGFSYLPWSMKTVGLAYEWLGLLAAPAAMVWGVRKGWNGLTYISAGFFVIYLYARLYHWWWEWMPNYAFFALLGLIAIGLMLLFRRLREKGGRA